MVKEIIYTDDGDFRPATLYSIVGATALLVGWFIFSALPVASGQLDSHFVCATEGCGHTQARKLQPGESFPALCPRCDKQSVYPALKCPRCGKPNIHHVMLGRPGPTRCSNCGTEVRHGG